MEETKVCKKCGTEKSVSEFCPSKRHRDRRLPTCRKCDNQIRQERKNFYNKKILEFQKAWKLENLQSLYKEDNLKKSDFLQNKTRARNYNRSCPWNHNYTFEI